MHLEVAPWDIYCLQLDIALWCKNQIEHSIWDESLLFSNCARSLEYSSSSTLAGLSNHICGIGLPLPFFNITCRGNHAFFKVITICFQLVWNHLSVGLHFCPSPPWWVRRLHFGIYEETCLRLFLHLFLIKWPFCFLLRSFTELLKQQAKSRKYYTRGTSYVSRDLCIAWCVDNVRMNNSRHCP